MCCMAVLCAAAQAGRHSAPEAEAFTAFRLPSSLPCRKHAARPSPGIRKPAGASEVRAQLTKPALAQNSPSHPCGPLSACGGQLCSVLKQAALDASPGAMRNPVWLRGSAPPMGPRTYRPGPLEARPWHEGRARPVVLAKHWAGGCEGPLRCRGAQGLAAARVPARHKHWIGALCLNEASRR